MLLQNFRPLFISMLASAALCCQAFAQETSPSAIAPENVPPRLSREFRAAWIASYSNIDWPSKPGLPVEKQKAELIALLDKAAALRLNAVILQIRPACDAFYNSSFEPWSAYLTGTMGQGPEGGFDPLHFAVSEAHARGLELHAWFNPYRAGLTSWKNISSKHISKTHPHLVRTYGKYLWLDPAEKAVQDHTTRVILDVVRRYDVDGIHMDDYFYPYPETNKSGGFLDFPDESAWKKYKASGGKLSRADWRRQNVNTLIQRLQGEIKREKKWVMFGVSPFGIWRPGHPPQIKGFDAYDRLYADAREWLVNGWVDYLAPQLYWAIDPPEQSFPALFSWWQEQNVKGLPIWPGCAVTRVGSRWPAHEIVRQVQITRQGQNPGHILWNISSVVRNPDQLQEKLLASVYQETALVPAVISGPALPKPTVKVEKREKDYLISFGYPSDQPVSFWVLQFNYGDRWTTEVVHGLAGAYALSLHAKTLQAVNVTAVSRYRSLSPSALVVAKPEL